MGLKQKISEGYFDNLGVNALWISAPYEQIHGWVTPGEDNDFAHYSYHGYYVLDYTEPDLNLGSKAQFKAMVDEAHRHGIRVVMDIVMNHAGYNTLQDMKEFSFGTIKSMSTAESYIHRITNVNGMHDCIDYEGSATDWGKWWGTDWVRSGLPGYSQGGGGDTEMCLAGLPDFRTESTKQVSIPTFLKTKWNKEGTYNSKISKYGSSNTVTGYISDWLSEWVRDYGIDGFRCDTAKHVEFKEWKTLKDKCVAALKTWRQNNPSAVGADWTDDFWMTGECWGHGLGKSGYYDHGGFDSMINFSFGGGVPDIGSINGVYQNYADTINSTSNFNALTYISSHDTNLARGNLIYQGSAFQLMPGAIQIFYGDESDRPLITSGMNPDANGSGHSLRSDMNWNSLNNSVLSHWQKVGKFRSRHIAVGAGDHSQISAYSADAGYTFARNYDDGETSDSVIVVMGAPSNKSIAVDVSSVWTNGTTLTNAYDNSTAVVTAGKATFNSGANGTILIEGPMPTIHMSLKGGKYSFYDSQTVNFSLRGAEYAMISVNGGTPFHAIDGQSIEIGEGIEVGTVFTVEATATNSEETITKPFTFKKKDPNAVTRVYFDNTSYKWSNVNIYIYDDTESEVRSNAGWPGDAMDYDSATGLYVYEVPDELVMGKAMFNAGNGSANRYPGEGVAGLAINETDMLFTTGNKWVPYNGQIVEPEPEPDPDEVYTVYYDSTSSNYNPPYIYYWVDSTDNCGWPGKAMQKVEGNLWKYTIPKKYKNVIFNIGSDANQTTDLVIPGDDYVFNGSGWAPLEDDPGDTQPTDPPAPDRILIGDVTRDGKITISDATAIQQHVAKIRTVTGDALTAADVNRNGTVDIVDASLVQHFLVQHTSRCGYAGRYADELQPVTKPTTKPTTQPTTEPDSDTYTIYFNNSVKNWATPHVYCWIDGTATAPAVWPGEAMTKVEGNIWKYTVDKQYNKCIFNVGSNADQTDDLTIPGDGYVSNGTDNWDKYDGGEPEQPEKKVIYFDNSSSNFNPPYIYCWIKNTTTSPVAWPGAAMTNISGNIWMYETDAKYDMCIFSNNGANKTTDLTVPGTNQIYNGTGWSAYSGGDDPTPPVSSTRTVYFNNSEKKYGTPYIYAWVKGTEDKYAVWPGTPMEKVSGDIYKFDVPVKYSCCIFNDKGGAQTADLDIAGDGYISSGTNSWTVYDPNSQPEPEPQPDNPTGVITLKFTNNGNWRGDIFCYYWGGATSGAGYPGNKMSSIGNNIYTIDIPADSKYVIFSADDRSQTGNIPIEGSAHYQTNGQQGNGWYNVQKIG